MRLSFISILYLLFQTWNSLSAQQKTVTYLWDRHYTFPDREIEIYHLKANLEILPYDTLVKAEAEFSFKTLREQIDSIVFQIPDIELSRVMIDGDLVSTETRGTDVIIWPGRDLDWQTDHKILFVYSAKPMEGLYFVGWNDPQQIKRKQIWAHRPDRWLPYSPAILTVEMSVTVPEDLKVFSNGVREDVVTNKNNTKTWMYRMNHPHPFFSTALVIGDYDFKTLTTKRGLPVELWYYPDWESHFEPTYKYQTEMFDFFEEELGFAYPWELYRQTPVIDYMYGAMETTTSTIFGDYLMVDERAFFGRNYINVNAHELAHQWFGNYISHLKHKDVWLTESFATYWAKMFEKHIFGEDHYQEIRNTELADVFAGAKKNNFSVGHSSGGRERVYQKGSLVLDMLRDMLGDKEFKAVMKYYLETYPYQTAETNDFLQAIRKVTGRSMEWFFEEWIYHGGEPEYEVSYRQIENLAGDGEVWIKVEQVHEITDLTGLFDMPFEIKVHFTDGTSTSVTTRIFEQQHNILIKNPERKTVEFVIFDPGRKIIKKVNFGRSYGGLLAQATKAENMIDRYDALLALRDFSQEEKTTDLINIYNNETFRMMKSEVIGQLAGQYNPQIYSVLVKAIHDPDDKVRMAALRNFPFVPDELRTEYESLLKDKSYFNVELALENLCRSFPENYGSYLDRTQDETGWRGKNIRIKWLEIAIQNGGAAFVPELKNYTSESYEFETRINAMNTLRRLNIFDEAVAGNLLQGLFYWNYKVRNASRENLEYFYRQNNYADMINNVVARGSFTREQLEKMSAWFLN